MGNKSISVKAPTSSEAMLLVASDPEITSILVVNVGSVIVELSNDVDMAAGEGDELAPNNYRRYNGVNDVLYGITSSGTGDLRITIIKGNGSVSGGRLETTGAGNTAAANHGVMSDGTDLVEATVPTVFKTTAITPNSTTTTEAAGTQGYTSNATGKGVRFVSDGSKWQLDTVYAEQVVQADEKTIATTGNTDAYMIAPEAGILAGVDFSAIDALAQHAANYLTFSITNLGQSGAGSTVMLAATDANTTKTTTGTAISANTKRSLTLNGTAANLVVAKGDRLLIRAASAATLANTLTGSIFLARFTRTA